MDEKNLTKTIAESLMKNSAKEIEYLTIAETLDMDYGFENLSDHDFEELCKEVSNLIKNAEVTIKFK